MTAEQTNRSRPRSRPRWSEAKKKAILERDGVYCRYCGAGPLHFRWGWPWHGRGVRLYLGQIQFDHVVPFSKGGSHDLENLVVCCRRCNLSKHDGPAADLLEPASLSLLPHRMPHYRPQPSAADLARRDAALGALAKRETA